MKRLTIAIDQELYEEARIGGINISKLIRDKILDYPIHHHKPNNWMKHKLNVAIPDTIAKEIKDKNINVSGTLERILAELT